MSIQTTSPSKKTKGQKGRKQTLEQRFQREWQRVCNARKRNERLRVEVSEFAANVFEQIREQEQACATAIYQQTEHLLQFMARKSLTEWQRQELVLWIIEHVDLLACHPFASHLDLDALKTGLEAAMPLPEVYEDDVMAGSAASAEAEKAGEFAAEETSDRQKSTDNFDMFEDLFAEFDREYAQQAQADDNTFDDEGDAFGRFHDDAFTRAQTEAEQQRQRELQDLDHLLKSSSLNKMFRKIASRLHPDREQDPNKKAEKHQQMTELVAARDDRDMLALFMLYERHIGEPVTQVIGADHERMITLLKHQYTQLQHEREQIIDDKPIEGMIYRHFKAPSKARLATKIKQHVKQLCEETEELEEFLRSTTSLQKLKPHLAKRNQRYADSMMTDFVEEMMFATRQRNGGY
jgi:hypothetical protein